MHTWTYGGGVDNPSSQPNSNFGQPTGHNRAIFCRRGTDNRKKVSNNVENLKKGGGGIWEGVGGIFSDPLLIVSADKWQPSTHLQKRRVKNLQKKTVHMVYG